MQDSNVALTGAHRTEIVRSFCFVDKVYSSETYMFNAVLMMLQYRIVLTAGEDGQIRAFQSG